MSSVSDEWRQEPDLDKLRAAYQRRQNDPVGAIAAFRELATRGSVKSLLYMAEMFRDGLGVEQNSNEAMKFFEQARKLGSLDGLLSLGMLYAEIGSIDKAEEVFKEGAKREYAPAMDRLAMIYLKERNDQNKAEAIELLEGASRIGNIYAKRHLGALLIRSGPGVAARLRGVSLVAQAFREGIQQYIANPHSDLVR